MECTLQAFFKKFVLNKVQLNIIMSGANTSFIEYYCTKLILFNYQSSKTLNFAAFLLILFQFSLNP